MVAGDRDRLSQLPDELLRHILRLAPCREAESTAVLSRRWRGLWPPPTADIRIRQDRRSAEDDLLAAAQAGPLERLAIHVGGGGESCCDLDAIVGDVLSHPACRGGVQDVRIGGGDDGDGGDDDDDDWNWKKPDWAMRGFVCSFCAVLPAAASLRVLHITNCCSLEPPPPPPPPPASSSTFVFPCLEALRLRRSSVSLESLQGMVVAAPRLAALQLEHVLLSAVATSGYAYGSWFRHSLRCPGVTALVLVSCRFEHQQHVAVELDAPRVRHFRYRGTISQFTLRSPMPDVRRACLHIRHMYFRDDEQCESFWSFLKNLSSARVLKLKLEWPIHYVAALESKEIRELLLENDSAQLIKFCVEQLEIDALHSPEGEGVGVAIGNLLQCCPALRELRLKLNTADQISDRRNWSASLQSKTQLDFHKSIDHFRRRRDDDTLVPLCVDEGKFEVISDIPGLSDRWLHFDCLQLHLKRLSLRFHLDKDNPSNCVGVRLMKFFIERAMALEEMYIDDGNIKLWEHMNYKISRYEGNNPQPFPEYHILARMSQALSGMNQFSSSKISGWFHQHKLQLQVVRRNNPWSTSRHFTILPSESEVHE